MPSTRTISKGIRIKNEAAEFFKGKPLNRYIECLHESIESGEIEIIDDRIVCTHSKKETVPEYVSRMNVAGAAYGLSGGELAEKLMDSMDSGAIILENGEFRAENEYDFEKFISACKDKNVPVQKMIDKCAQMIWGM